MTSDRPDHPEQDTSNRASANHRSNRKRTLIRIAKLAILAVVVIGFVLAARSAVDQWNTQNDKIQDEITQIDQQLESLTDPSEQNAFQTRREALLRSRPSVENLNWTRIAIAFVLYAVGLLIPGFVLHSALRSLSQRPRVPVAIASQLIGHAGKYVPGKAMVIVLRAGGLAIDGVKPVVATICIFMETLLMMGVGAVVACAVVWWLDIPDWMKWSAAAVAVLASIPTLPPILKFVAAKVANTKAGNTNSTSTQNPAGQTQLASQTLPISSTRFFLTGWAWSILSWLLIGASFTFLVSAIPATDAAPSILTSGFFSLAAVSTAAIALAMVIGFASLIPGGAVVRELVITTILTTAVGPVQAILSAIAARILFIVVEAVCATIAWRWLSKQQNQSQQ